jgi:hypothetical protein
LQDTKSRDKLLKNIHDVNANTFMNVAMEVFWYQYHRSSVYRNYVNQLVGEENVKSLNQPVFLPIEAFKIHQIKSGDWDAQDVFTSSGTSRTTISKHYVREMELYLKSCKNSWECFFNSVDEYCYLCLLPGYMERKGSSLIHMMKHFVEQSKYASGFYLYNHEELYEKLLDCKAKDIPTVLFGVSFGLLDFIENYELEFPNLIIMETGGMKGRREELLKVELHKKIAEKFKVNSVYSEYGMTELFSQAYSTGKGRFRCSNSMKIWTTEITDPLSKERYGKTGILNIIDLYNIDSCAFIQTQDLGIVHEDESFELMGRLDHADIRGCNLMVV